MKPQETGKAYNQITHLWEREEFDMTNGIAQHQRAIRFVKHRGNALDIGCGCTGRFIELLVNEGFKPTGLDISEEMLALARRKHPDISFVQGDICTYMLPDKYDFITAWDSIWHIPLSEQEPVLAKIINSLNPGGVFIFSFGGTTQAGCHTNNAMGPEVYYSSLGVTGFLQLFIDMGCIIRHLEFDQYPEVHTYLVVEKP
ncbi:MULTISPECIES: class I SAM-dependent methyltransferase [unclassified Pseudoalteromonas]|uniref:class I SAM-dependent DNA methyltransferase n=1 Tax=unclassified Pseudoalteromonas TaxID=194690 RepID=UPI002097BE04|nr:class I SAM-dependent methyltransferase [Pseudoalteromonas sp. XMcav2-N]MCO7189106.1 class I SAM-dependent methyltransferase [Pseudoalteromonas sp. XMcav2-N]